jgi:hypothetical protein
VEGLGLPLTVVVERSYCGLARAGVAPRKSIAQNAGMANHSLLLDGFRLSGRNGLNNDDTFRTMTVLLAFILV